MEWIQRFLSWLSGLLFGSSTHDEVEDVIVVDDDNGASPIVNEGTYQWFLESLALDEFWEDDFWRRPDNLINMAYGMAEKLDKNSDKAWALESVMTETGAPVEAAEIFLEATVFFICPEHLNDIYPKGQ